MKKYQRKTKPVTNRIDLDKISPEKFGRPFAEMNPEQREAAIQKLALEADAEFRCEFEPAKLLREHNLLKKFLTEDGWTASLDDTCYVKDGVYLNSTAGFAKARVWCAANLRIQRMFDIMKLVLWASPQELRNLRLAFYAGVAVAESRDYGSRKGGKDPVAKVELEKAISTWKTQHPNAKREPVGTDLSNSKCWPTSLGTTPRPIPKPRTIDNQISKYFPRRKR